MSSETLSYLNSNTLIGFTDKRGKAWHYRAELQGTELNHYPGAIPIDDVKRRLMGWDALTFPATVIIPAGGPGNEDGAEDLIISDPTRQIVIRSDNHKFLHQAMESYRPHQYRDVLLDNVSHILDDELQIASAGLLKGGSLGWVQCEMPENVETPEGVTFRPFLLAFSSLDGTTKSGYQRGFVNVVCDNTFNMFRNDRRSGALYTVKHTKYSEVKIADARQALDIVFSSVDEINAEIKQLCEIGFTDKMFSAFLDEIAPMPVADSTGKVSKNAETRADAKRGVLSQLYRFDPRCSPWNGTAWGVVQTVNTFQQHNTQMRGVGDSEFERGPKIGERAQLRAINGDLDKDTTSTLTAIRKVLATV